MVRPAATEARQGLAQTFTGWEILHSKNFRIRCLGGRIGKGTRRESTHLDRWHILCNLHAEPPPREREAWYVWRPQNNCWRDATMTNGSLSAIAGKLRKVKEDHIILRPRMRIDVPPGLIIALLPGANVIVVVRRVDGRNVAERIEADRYERAPWQ